ncbi:AmpG family muropeptide MFS transporter [Methylohalobius crimeensis]|uniref:AmpG family muropeptide MFS transporter n=1 Tax=Methylohalobius crimeensis TaxID=244365 RepID=UPI0003B76CAB|nr:AmpG family muropeptide MFS transporter [Methylohalobius crimeensis]
MTILSERSWLRSIINRRMTVAFAMGFYSGLPLLLTGSVLQAWMRGAGVDLTTIGLFALVGLPYTGKFLWAPLFDRFVPPGGRRRGWLLWIQLMLALAIVGLGFTHPEKNPFGVALVALIVTFLSASQDTLIDAYRRESLSDREQGLGASLYVNGYRLGMLLTSGGGLILADFLGFQKVYGICGIMMATAVLVTFWAQEPKVEDGTPVSLTGAVVEPFLEFFRRRDAVSILLFVFLYKLGDTMASHMTMPFYLDLGFSKTEIGTVVKLFGFWATVIGGLLGGALILRLGIYPALWLFGILQAVSTAGFALLAYLGPNLLGLTGVISFENLSGGMGTAAFVAFMASQTDKRFTATQYALLSSLMGIPRVIVAAPTGWLAQQLGWIEFFVGCAVVAMPGLLLLLRMRRWLEDPLPAVGQGAVGLD